MKSATGFRDCDPWRPEHFMGSGGLYATAGDLLRWNRALHEGRLLPPEWMDLLRSPYSEGPPRHAYAVDHFTLRRPDAAAVPLPGSMVGPLVEEALAADDLARAKALCEVWREAAPEAVGPLLTMARVQGRLDGEGEEEECYRRILELQSDNAVATKALGAEGRR